MQIEIVDQLLKTNLPRSIITALAVVASRLTEATEDFDFRSHLPGLLEEAMAELDIETTVAKRLSAFDEKELNLAILREDELLLLLSKFYSSSDGLASALKAKFGIRHKKSSLPQLRALYMDCLKNGSVLESKKFYHSGVISNVDPQLHLVVFSYLFPMVIDRCDFDKDYLLSKDEISKSSFMLGFEAGDDMKTAVMDYLAKFFNGRDPKWEMTSPLDHNMVATKILSLI